MSDGFISVFTFSCKLGWINQSSVVKLPLDLDPVPKKLKLHYFLIFVFCMKCFDLCFVCLPQM